VLLEIVKGGARFKPVTVLGLTDFHGQLEPTTLSMDSRNISVGGAAYLATLFDEEAAWLPGPALLLASGDNVGASPANSGLLQDAPAIDVENAWGLDATSYGNHEFDYGLERLLMHQERADFPFLGVNIIETATGKAPDWVKGTEVFKINGLKVGVIGVALENTPELVRAGATEGLTFLPAAESIRKASKELRKQGVRIQIVVIHEGSSLGSNAVDGIPAVPWVGPIIDIAQMIQDTTVDVVLAGHTHRISNLMVGKILVAEGLNAGASYSVLQMMVTNGDVWWAGAATRLAKVLGVGPRSDVQAIIDDANAETAVLRNQVIGTQQFDILRDPARLHESAMGNLVTDAMRLTYPGIDAAYTNSGGLRADLVCSPPSAGEAACEITWGEMFSVLPFGNRTVIETLTYDQLVTAFQNGFSPACDPAIHTGRFPQISGLKAQFHCDGATPVIDNIWKTPEGIGGPQILLGPADTIRLVTNDFMFTGGDGYTVLSQGTDVLMPGDDLLELTINYVAANSPVGPVVEGRIVGP
jgi:2',3'-cyclic-nucleotide 2'-phosphodiesterase (5'-nucleotidase family)